MNINIYGYRIHCVAGKKQGTIEDSGFTFRFERSFLKKTPSEEDYRVVGKAIFDGLKKSQFLTVRKS